MSLSASTAALSLRPAGPWQMAQVSAYFGAPRAATSETFDSSVTEASSSPVPPAVLPVAGSVHSFWLPPVAEPAPARTSSRVVEELFPLLYGTTPAFLALLGLGDARDLPQADEFTVALRPHRPENLDHAEEAAVAIPSES